jgi:hypothetical protein
VLLHSRVDLLINGRRQVGERPLSALLGKALLGGFLGGGLNGTAEVAELVVLEKEGERSRSG